MSKQELATISIDSLVAVTGGAGGSVDPSEKEKLAGCVDWAANSPGLQDKHRLCHREFVRRNWNNFAPQR